MGLFDKLFGGSQKSQRYFRTFTKPTYFGTRPEQFIHRENRPEHGGKPILDGTPEQGGLIPQGDTKQLTDEGLSVGGEQPGPFPPGVLGPGGMVAGPGQPGLPGMIAGGSPFALGTGLAQLFRDTRGMQRPTNINKRFRPL